MLIARCPVDGLVPPREIYAHGAHYIEIETSDLPHAADAWVTCVQAMPHIDPSWPRQLFVTLTAAPAGTPSIWTTLRNPRFRALWSSGGIYFVGNAMQTMAAAWMVVELTGSSFLAALVQTAVFLPMFLLSLPAGVLADITDRRRLIQASLVVQAIAGTLMAVLLLAGIGGAGMLLFMVFVAGCCAALLSPAWNSTIGDAVGREDLPQAITCVSIAYNAARAVGPALAGLVFTAVGGAWNFVIAVVSVVVMALTIRRYPPRPHPPSRLPAERLWGGMLSALRFAWHSQTVLAQLVRTVAYSGAGSALWALLPMIGQQKLGLGAAGYGLLMGHYSVYERKRADAIPMTHLILFSIYSTRRQEETCRIVAEDVNIERAEVIVRDMKNPGEKMGNDVTTNLTPEALKLITDRGIKKGRLWPYNAESVSTSFTRACKILGIEDLHFHDLRHEGISRLFELGWSIPHVATVSGHRSWKSLQRYTHIKQVGDKYKDWHWKVKLLGE